MATTLTKPPQTVKADFKSAGKDANAVPRDKNPLRMHPPPFLRHLFRLAGPQPQRECDANTARTPPASLADSARPIRCSKIIKGSAAGRRRTRGCTGEGASRSTFSWGSSFLDISSNALTITANEPLQQQQELTATTTSQFEGCRRDRRVLRRARRCLCRVIIVPRRLHCPCLCLRERWIGILCSMWRRTSYRSGARSIFRYITSYFFSHAKTDPGR